MKRFATWCAAAALAAPLVAQEPTADERLRALERQNQEILERLRASEARNQELEGKLGALAEERKAEETEAAVETELNTLNARLQDSVNWKQLTKSGNPIRFYGFLRTDAYYSTGRFNDPHLPQWVLREGDGTGGTVLSNDDEFTYDVRLTRFAFDLNAGKAAGAELTGKLETDFANTPVKSVATSGSPVTSVREVRDESRHTPRIRLAYLNADFGDVAIRVGQDWDTIAPLNPAVNAETLLWNAGNLGDRRPMATFMWDGGDAAETSFQLKISAGLTSAVDAADIDANGQKDGWDAGHPHLQARFGVATPGWVDKKMINAGAWAYWARSEADTNVYDGDNHAHGWAFGYDVVLPIIDCLSFRSEGFVGQALADVRGGIAQSFNGAGDEISTWGGWAELEFRCDELTLSVGVSIDNPDNDDLAAGGRDKNWTMYLGAKYDLGGGWMVGADAIYWETQYLALGIGNALRFDVYTMLSF
ncbi:MAG TPA: hypothetical protein VEI02_06115 [Planctomycetota bacterium]|nr:hypothetical protein [Planctomycetota bacterium]